MRTFLAILRDSFREAVDGFVIYIMLALSALTIFIVAASPHQIISVGQSMGIGGHSAVRFFIDKISKKHGIYDSMSRPV